MGRKLGGAVRPGARKRGVGGRLFGETCPTRLARCRDIAEGAASSSDAEGVLSDMARPK